MRRNIKKITAAVMVLALLLCCGCAQGKKGIVFPEDELLSEYRSGKDKNMEVLQDEGRAKALRFYRGDVPVYGEIYLPEGEGPFPVIIISGGFGTSHYGYQSMAAYFAERGFAGVVYDPSEMGFTGNPAQDYLDWTPLKEAADIEAIAAALSKLEYIDENNVFLWGHSMGGFVSAYVGFKNPELIRGLVLVEPAFYLNENAKEMFPDTEDIPEFVTADESVFPAAYFKDLCSFDIFGLMKDCGNKVLIYAGGVSPSVGADMPELLERAKELLPSAELKFIDDADHYFSGMPMNLVVIGTVSYVNSNMYKAEK